MDTRREIELSIVIDNNQTQYRSNRNGTYSCMEEGCSAIGRIDDSYIYLTIKHNHRCNNQTANIRENLHDEEIDQLVREIREEPLDVLTMPHNIGHEEVNGEAMDIDIEPNNIEHEPMSIETEPNIYNNKEEMEIGSDEEIEIINL